MSKEPKDPIDKLAGKIPQPAKPTIMTEGFRINISDAGIIIIFRSGNMLIPIGMSEKMFKRLLEGISIAKNQYEEKKKRGKVGGR